MDLICVRRAQPNRTERSNINFQFDDLPLYALSSFSFTNLSDISPNLGQGGVSEHRRHRERKRFVIYIIL